MSLKLYGVFTPRGRLVDVERSVSDAWSAAWFNQDLAFRTHYWKRPRASKRALKKAGWRVEAGHFASYGRAK